MLAANSGCFSIKSVNCLDATASFDISFKPVKLPRQLAGLIMPTALP